MRLRLVLSVLAMLAALAGGVDATSASMSATTGSTSSVGLDALRGPTALTAAAAGIDVDLSWSSGEFASGDVAGTRVRSLSLGVEADPRTGAAPTTCDASAAFDTSVGRADAQTATITDAGVGAAGDAGSWRCYIADSEYPLAPAAATWFSDDAAVALVQLGHVVRSVTLVDGGTPGQLRAGDAIVFTFDQAVDTTTGPQSTTGAPIPTAGNDICVHVNNATLVVARTEAALNTNCAANAANLSGKLATGVFTPTGQRNSYAATYTWSDCDAPTSCRTMTAAVGARYRGTTDVSVDLSGATLTPTATSGVLTTPDGTALCATANNARHTCRPVVTGSL